MTDILQEIQQAETVSQLGALMYRAETAEEHAAICLREAQILGTPLFIDATEEAAPHPLEWFCPTCGVPLTTADQIPCGVRECSLWQMA